MAVVGSRDAGEEQLALAEQVGEELGRRGAVVVTGGLDGVMEAASKGARGAGATTVGLLPGMDREAANPDVEIALATGLGEARNVIVARSADALIAVGGAFGTLSEIAFALGEGKPVAALGSWELSLRGELVEGIRAVGSPEEAVKVVLGESKA